MKLKIVIIVEAMLGGIRQHVCDIIRNLNHDKYELYLVYSEQRADKTFELDKDNLSQYAKLIKCNEMQRSIGRHDYLAYKKLIEILKDIQPDIVHCHSSKAGIVGRMAAKKCGIPKIIYTPNAYVFQNPNISNIVKIISINIEKFLSRYATTKTINVSKGEMQLALDYKIDVADKFTLIYNGIPYIELPDQNTIRKQNGLKEDVYYIGVTARCAQQKDPMTFLRIAEKVISQKEGIEFLYIGDGDMQDEMKAWIAARKLQNKIHMLGFRNDAALIVGALNLYLSTALYEGLPYSMLEAMRAGVPIIATNTVGNNELVFDGENGVLFPVGDIDRACELILEQIHEKSILTHNVKETYDKKFSLERMVSKLNECYVNLGGG